MEEKDPIVSIDGSLHEGGGQIIRSSIALSNILQKPLELSNIRVSRPNPGLNNQLIGSIKLMQEITEAQVSNCKNKELKMSYQPKKKITSGKYEGGSHSASAISLMAQTLIPTLIFGKEQSFLRLQGGTDVNKSPPAQSIQRILLPLLSEMGVHFEYNVIKEGYYPKGGGKINIKIQPIENCIKPITLVKRNPITKIYLEYILTDTCTKTQKEYFRPLKKDIVNYLIMRQAEDGTTEESIEFEVETKVVNNKKYKECLVIVAHAYSDGGYFAFTANNDDDNLPVDDLINKVYQNFVKELSHGGCLDEYHQDQLLLFMGLADGQSQIRVGPEITEHSLASFYVLKQFLPAVEIDVKEEEIKGIKSNLITIKGVAFKNT